MIWLIVAVDVWCIIRWLIALLLLKTGDGVVSQTVVVYLLMWYWVKIVMMLVMLGCIVLFWVNWNVGYIRCLLFVW